MKILFIGYEYPPLGGGAATAAFNLLNHLGRQISVDALVASEDKSKIIINKKIRIYKLNILKNKKNQHVQTYWDLIKFFFISTFYALKLATKNKYSLIHVFFTLPCGATTLILNKIFKTPYVVSLRGADVPGYNPYRFSLIYSLFKPLIRQIWKNASRVTTNSLFLKKLAHQLSPQLKIKIIPNGVNTLKFKPIVKEGKGNKKIKILYTGRLTYRKGVDILIKGVSLLPYYLKEKVKLIIVGKGEQEKNLKNLVKKLNLQKLVVFKGIISREKMPQIYQQADLFVLPSRTESMSNSLLEAAASGLPLIASTACKDLIKHYPLKNFTTPSALKNLIINIIANKKKREEARKASLKLAKTYSWNKMAQEYLTIYRSLEKKTSKKRKVI